ncbi:hypothetical protein BJF91_22075 [Allorhizobium taibaishanense]|uniref:Uncharacterized protein n=1 Tax=Allorhizobium taibaishanense TaxID=887144 RepID=A0A1Q9A539_9HYPH|nr:hypothetical protein [Allorhizobium taibaishanense]OLP49693.1 hypothetical protein BJF91_22075 [Allorhizobium taibaishanense]
MVLMLAQIAAMDNYMKSYMLLYLVTAFVAQFTSTASAGTAEPHIQRIQAAIVLKQVVEPIIGEAQCRADSKCVIISDTNTGVKATVERRGEGPYGGSRLTVDCPGDCSFASGKITTSFYSEREFDLFRGADNHIEILPVLRPRTKLGKIVLIIE